MDQSPIITRYSTSFTDSGEWEIVLPNDADLNDLAALSPVVHAIFAFARIGREPITA